jgi:hypothetical protein
MNKQAENIDRLTDFALDSFGIANPIKEKEKVCPICKKKYPVNEFEGDICMTCYNIRTEVDGVDEKLYESEPADIDNGEEDRDYEYERRAEYVAENMPSN